MLIPLYSNESGKLLSLDLDKLEDILFLLTLSGSKPTTLI